MIIVSDATPINHLILADSIFILPAMLGKVIIPDAVFRELTDARAPEMVRQFAIDRPDWLEVRTPVYLHDGELDVLDEGERQAITLAEELGAELLLMDERRGREIALHRDLPVVGTLGILERASEKGLIDFQPVLNKLKATGFYISKNLERKFLDRNRGISGS